MNVVMPAHPWHCGTLEYISCLKMHSVYLKHAFKVVWFWNKQVLPKSCHEAPFTVFKNVANS